MKMLIFVATGADEDGIPATKQTIELLQRRHVGIDQIKYTRKESDNLERSIQEQFIRQKMLCGICIAGAINGKRIRPTLKKVPLSELINETGFIAKSDYKSSE